MCTVNTSLSSCMSMEITSTPMPTGTLAPTTTDSPQCLGSSVGIELFSQDGCSAGLIIAALAVVCILLFFLLVVLPIWICVRRRGRRVRREVEVGSAKPASSAYVIQNTPIYYSPLHAQDPPGPTFPLAAVATGTTQQQEPEYSRVYQKIEPREVPTKIVTQGGTVEYEEPGGANQGYTPLNIRTMKHNSTYSKSFSESTSGVAEGVAEPSTDKIVTQGGTVEYEEPGGGANQGPGVYAPLNVRTMKHDNTYSTFLTQSTGKDWLGASGVAEPSSGKIVTQRGTVEYEEPGGTNQGPGIYTPLNVSTMKQQGSMYNTSLTQSTSKDWLGASGVVKPSRRKKVQSGGDLYAGIETETLNKPSEYAQHK